MTVLPTSDFDYDLPPERIAQEPLPERDQARMLVVDCARGSLRHERVSALPACLDPGDLLVVNDTRVIPARVFGNWEDTGGRVELLMVEPGVGGRWRVLAKSRRRPLPGLRLRFGGGESASVVVVAGEGHLTLDFADARVPWALMEREGTTPLPPYIQRDGADAALAVRDVSSYQTLFAAEPGAVAAPTAGLHFTPRLLAALEARGVGRATVTLHVGPGTFRPVKTEDANAHLMDAERFRLPEATCAAVGATCAAGRRVVAVGSTVVRTLEAAAGGLGGVRAGDGRTDLYIRPPYPFQVVGAMLTNFHLPRSTLLMMVSAFAAHAAAGGRGGGDAERGRRLVLEAYRVAVAEGYRFYSYGDCMLLL